MMNLTIGMANARHWKAIKNHSLVLLGGAVLAFAAVIGAFDLKGTDSNGPASRTFAPSSVAIHSSSAPSLLTFYLVDSEEAAAYLRAQDAEVANAGAAGTRFVLVGRTPAEGNALALDMGGDWQVIDLRSR